jgi:hypothetical protein
MQLENLAPTSAKVILNFGANLVNFFFGANLVIFFLILAPLSLQVLNEVRRLEESALRNDEELRQMALEQQQQQRHLVATTEILIIEVDLHHGKQKRLRKNFLRHLTKVKTAHLLFKIVIFSAQSLLFAIQIGQDFYGNKRPAKRSRWAFSLPRTQ